MSVFSAFRQLPAVAQLSAKVGAWCQHLLPIEAPEPLTLKAFSRLSERYVLADYLTYGYADAENALIWLDDCEDRANSALLGYELTPVILAGEKVATAFEKLIQRLPVGSIVYSIAHAGSDIETALEDWAMSRSDHRSAVFDLMTEQRARYLLRWCQGRHFPLGKSAFFRPRSLRYYLFVRIPANFSEVTQEACRHYLSSLDQVHHHVEAQLNNAALPVRRLSAKAMALTLKGFIHLHVPMIAHQEDGISMAQSLSPQLVPPWSQQSIDAHGTIELTDTRRDAKTYLGVMTVSRYADQRPHYLSAMQHCIGSPLDPMEYIPSNFYAFTVIEKQDSRALAKVLTKKLANAEWHTSVDSAIFQNLFRRHHQVKQNGYKLIEQVNNGAGVAKVITGMVMSAPEKALLADYCAAAETAWRAAGMELVRESAIAMPMWLASLPGRFVPSMDGVSQGLQRGVTMTAFNAATCVHVQGDWTGSMPHEGGLLLLTRRGALSVMNLFQTVKANYNCLVAAASGSGKSFLMADWVSDFLARKGLVRILDAGRSYYNLAELLDGQNVVCDEASGLCFNIFATLTTQAALEESLTTITHLVVQMCFSGVGEGGDAPPNWEESFIGQAIELLWHQHHQRQKNQQNQNSSVTAPFSLADLYDYCEREQDKDPRIKDLVLLLYKWAKGHYAKWFVADWNIDFDNPLMVFELDELKKDKGLQNVILNLLLARMADEMYGAWLQAQPQSQSDQNHTNPENALPFVPKAVIIDEAWDLLARPHTARFIEEAARRVRKYGGSIIIITQSFLDMDSSSAARAFIQNCNWIIALMQDIGTVKSAVDKGLIDLKDHALQLLEGLHKTSGYSELYVLNKSVKGEGVYRLSVDAASYWAYTTDASEKQRLKQLLKQGHSIASAIAQLSKNGSPS